MQEADGAGEKAQEQGSEVPGLRVRRGGLAGQGEQLVGLRAAVSGADHGAPLQAGQYTSVFLDNASGSALTARSGSHFSAVLLGV